MNSDRNSQWKRSQRLKKGFGSGFSSGNCKTDDFQPTILRKQGIQRVDSNSSEGEDKRDCLKAAPEPLVMKKSVAMTGSSSSLTDYLNPENSNFYVVGVIGMKDSGKSTILNLIATGELNRSEVNGKGRIQAPLFDKTSNPRGFETFITESRLFLIDSSPILYDFQNGGFIMCEAENIRQVQTMLRMCNELILVYESHQLMNLIRMLVCAKNLMKPYESNEPEIILIENRVQRGSTKNPITNVAKSVLLKSNVSDNISSISVPDFAQKPADFEDPLETMNQLRDAINTRKELNSYKDSLETEKTWWERFCQTTNDCEDFFANFEVLRGKYYQQNEDLYKCNDSKSIH